MRCVQKRVALIETIAEVAPTIFSHTQVHMFGWKKFEHPKSILSTASKLPSSFFWLWAPEFRCEPKIGEMIPKTGHLSAQLSYDMHQAYVPKC